MIGGGPAGSAAAIGLARSGRSVLLLERERAAHDKVCGEFLSVEACAEAASLGVDPRRFGAAEIDGVRVSWGRASVATRLPFRAASLSRKRFDEALLEAALAAGVRIVRGVRVTSIAGPTVTVVVDARERTYDGAAIVLASGKSELAGYRRTGGHFPDALGFKMHLELEAGARAELGTNVELTLFEGGYCGMQRIEDHGVAFAVVVRREAYAALRTWPELVRSIAGTNARLRQRLAGARERWPKPLAVSGVPYGFVLRDTSDARPYRVGDQLAVIPSFTGDGMAIALVSGSAAARAIANGVGPAAFHRAMLRRLRGPMRVSGALSHAIATPAGRAAVMWPASLAPGIFALAAAYTRIER